MIAPPVPQGFPSATTADCDALESAEAGQPASPGKTPSPLRWRTFLLLIAAPAAVLAALMSWYAVDGPHYDQWISEAPLFEKMGQGTLGLADFFAQNNEHRLPVPKLVFFALGLLTKWNTRAEICLTWGVLALTAAGYWRLLQITGWRESRRTAALFFLMAALVFHTRQEQNLLWGFQFAFVLPLLFGLAAYLAALELRPPWNFCAAMGLSVLALYSTASGLACWFLAVPLLLLPGGKPAGSGQAKWWGLYALAFLLSLACYFHGYVKPEQSPSPWLALREPVLAARFFCAYLGSPFSYGAPGDSIAAAQVLGAILLALYAGAAAWLWRERRDARLVRRMLPWLVVAATALANALLTTVGRLGLGLVQAMESRYASYSILLPIGLLPLGALILEHGRARRGPAWKFGRPALSVLLVGFIAMFGLSEATSLRAWNAWRHLHLMCKAFVQAINLVDQPNLFGHFVSPSMATLPRSAREMDRRGYLRPGLLWSPLVSGIGDAQAPGDLKYGRLQSATIPAPGEIELAGWALLPERGESADAVFLSYEDGGHIPVIFAVSSVMGASDEVVRATGVADYRLCLWATRLSTDRLPPGQHTIKAWAYDAEARKGYRLKGEMTVNR